MPNEKLALQKLKLQSALHYANIIEKCDAAIAVGRHVNYFKGVKREAVQGYADSLADIIESAIDISVQFSKPPITADNFLEQMHIICTDYNKTITDKRNNGITY